jgi:hypothetical protein
MKFKLTCRIDGGAVAGEVGDELELRQLDAGIDGQKTTS